ncbi:MAG TPA: enoyl-CoA hydratase/isomerase family protein [Burkholderiaceae bacterium]|nr:enoyl-CoA hydratase/isomerase family protein [Burkholderiaceae bacterium]
MPVHLNIAGQVASVTLDSPGKLNAISVAMWRELARIFGELARDDAVRCIVVGGADGNFAAGADISEFATVRFDQASGRRFHLEILGAAIEAIRTVPQPVIAAIEGFCIGGGLEIAVACDLRIAVDDARIGAPVGKVGFPFALPELLPLLALVGPGVAADLLLAGRVFSGREAQEAGLVQRAIPRDDHRRVIDEIVRAIVAGSPAAARQNKAQIRSLLDGGFRYSQAQLEASFAFLDSDDYREGIAAFLAKRPPQFAGK